MILLFVARFLVVVVDVIEATDAYTIVAVEEHGKIIMELSSMMMNEENVDMLPPLPLLLIILLPQLPMMLRLPILLRPLQQLLVVSIVTRRQLSFLTVHPPPALTD
jgi:hypothetical protein